MTLNRALACFSGEALRAFRSNAFKGPLLGVLALGPLLGVTPLEAQNGNNNITPMAAPGMAPATAPSNPSGGFLKPAQPPQANPWDLQLPLVSSGNPLELHPELLPPKSSWAPPMTFETRWYWPSRSVVTARLLAQKNLPDIADPLVMRLQADSLPQFVQALQKEDAPPQGEKLRQLYLSLGRRRQGTDIPLVAEDLEWLDLLKVAQIFRVESTWPSVPLSDWKAFEKGDVRQWEGFFGEDPAPYLKAGNQWLKSHPNANALPLAALLPEHVLDQMGGFSAWRGRNCFATALGFHFSRVVQNPQINVVREEFHDFALINNDEFAQGLWLGFRQLSQKELDKGLRWGDIVTFYDAEEGSGWGSFKHAAVHLAGDVYLHKGSKSASTPVEFVRWYRMVQVWQKYTARLGVSVWRRVPGRPTGQFPKEHTALESITWSR